MTIDGSYFFTDELDDVVLAVEPIRSPRLRDRAPDEGDPIEGESLPEDVLRVIRSWLGV